MHATCNVISTVGAFATAAGAGVVAYGAHLVATDSVISSTAAICKTAFSYSSEHQLGAKALHFLAPRAMPIAESAFKAVCEVTIRIDNYSQIAVCGFAIISAGSLVFALSRCATRERGLTPFCLAFLAIGGEGNQSVPIAAE